MPNVKFLAATNKYNLKKGAHEFRALCHDCEYDEYFLLYINTKEKEKCKSKTITQQQAADWLEKHTVPMTINVDKHLIRALTSKRCVDNAFTHNPFEQAPYFRAALMGNTDAIERATREAAHPKRVRRNVKARRKTSAKVIPLKAAKAA